MKEYLNFKVGCDDLYYNCFDLSNGRISFESDINLMSHDASTIIFSICVTRQV